MPPRGGTPPTAANAGSEETLSLGEMLEHAEKLPKVGGVSFSSKSKRWIFCSRKLGVRHYQSFSADRYGFYRAWHLALNARNLHGVDVNSHFRKPDDDFSEVVKDLPKIPGVTFNEASRRWIAQRQVRNLRVRAAFPVGRYGLLKGRKLAAAFVNSLTPKEYDSDSRMTSRKSSCARRTAGDYREDIGVLLRQSKHGVRDNTCMLINQYNSHTSGKKLAPKLPSKGLLGTKGGSSTQHPHASADIHHRTTVNSQERMVQLGCTAIGHSDARRLDSCDDQTLPKVLQGNKGTTASETVGLAYEDTNLQENTCAPAKRGAEGDLFREEKIKRRYHSMQSEVQAVVGHIPASSLDHNRPKSDDSHTWNIGEYGLRNSATEVQRCAKEVQRDLQILRLDNVDSKEPHQQSLIVDPTISPAYSASCVTGSDAEIGPASLPPGWLPRESGFSELYGSAFMLENQVWCAAGDFHSKDINSAGGPMIPAAASGGYPRSQGSNGISPWWEEAPCDNPANSRAVDAATQSPSFDTQTYDIETNINILRFLTLHIATLCIPNMSTDEASYLRDCTVLQGLLSQLCAPNESLLIRYFQVFIQHYMQAYVLPNEIEYSEQVRYVRLFLQAASSCLKEILLNFRASQGHENGSNCMPTGRITWNAVPGPLW